MSMPRADQNLQQFLNQSPWAWQPVLERTAAMTAASFDVRAWVVEEVVLPKNGALSVGVEKQYAPSLSRRLNCQLGLTLSLVGDQGSVPVNWRLMLPGSWDRDATRRSQTGVPEHEGHRHRWEHALDMMDELAHDWGLPARPVLIDARRQRSVDPLLLQLQRRGLRYVVNVPTSHAAVMTSTSAVTAPNRTAVTVPQTGMMRLTRRIGSSHSVGPLTFVEVPNQSSTVDSAHSPSQRVITGWRRRESDPVAAYLTNLTDTGLSELVDLVDTQARFTAAHGIWQQESGVRHFEGRSYRGWHHHVTLTSVAKAYELTHAAPVEGPTRRRLNDVRS